MGNILKNYSEDGTKMVIYFNKIEDADWEIILDEVRDKSHPLKELELSLSAIKDEPIKPGFIELMNIIGSHTTLIKFECLIYSVENDDKPIILLKALKDNRSIKNLLLGSHDFDSKTAHALAESLINNRTLISFDISVCSSYGEGYA